MIRQEEEREKGKALYHSTARSVNKHAMNDAIASSQSSWERFAIPLSRRTIARSITRPYNPYTITSRIRRAL